MKNQSLNWAICDEIEHFFKVFIDIEAGTYNRDSYNAASSWQTIPENWIKFAKYILDLDQKTEDRAQMAAYTEYWELYIEKHGL